MLDAGRLMQQEITVVDQVSGPPRVVEGVPNVVKAVKDVDCIGEERDESDGDRAPGPDDQRKRPARQECAEWPGPGLRPRAVSGLSKPWRSDALVH